MLKDLQYICNYLNIEFKVTDRTVDLKDNYYCLIDRNDPNLLWGCNITEDFNSPLESLEYVLKKFGTICV